jgi:hypothetical protein
MLPEISFLIWPIMIFAVPIVSILTRHQRQMAEIIHGRSQREAVEAELQGLRHEVNDLRSRLITHTLAIDSISQQQKALGGEEPIRQRLG